VPQTRGGLETRKPGNATECLVTGLDGGHKTHAIDSRDRKSMVPAVLAARDCRRESSIVRALDLHLGLPDFGKTPENLRPVQLRCRTLALQTQSSKGFPLDEAL
jgi:hypothetical protein